MGNSIIKIRRPRDSLFFIMGIPLLVRPHLYIETAAWILEIQSTDNRLKILLHMAEISESDTIFFLSTVNVAKLDWPPSGAVYLKHTIYEWTQLQYKPHAFLHKASLDPGWQGKGITVLQLAVSYGYTPCMIFKIFVVKYLFPIWAIIRSIYTYSLRLHGSNGIENYSRQETLKRCLGAHQTGPKIIVYNNVVVISRGGSGSFRYQFSI